MRVPVRMDPTPPIPSRARPDGLRVVVTGATGNVGTAVVRALGGEPMVDSVVGLARRRPQWATPKTTFHAVDVTTDALVGHLDGADALILMTEWLVYRNPDFERVRKLLRRPLLLDGRTLYEPERMATLGFEYHGIGRRPR